MIAAAFPRLTDGDSILTKGNSRAFIWSTAAVLVALAAAWLLARHAALPNTSMVFLMAVLFAAVTFGMWPAIYASVLSFLVYNFFLIEPLYTFQIAEPQELLALVIFLIVAVVTSTLAGRVRDQALRATERARTTHRLYEFTWKLSGIAADSTADGAAGEIYASLRRPTVILLEEEGQLSLAAAWPPEDNLDDESKHAARLAFVNKESASSDAGGGASKWYFIPLRTQRRLLGVAGVARDADGASLDYESRALLTALAEQAAAAIDRAFLAREMTGVRNTAETERIRNILLSSISHDFRTPLASIMGAATSLLDYRDKFDDSAQADLLQGIKTEAEGLDEMVRNLLAITRIDAGVLDLRRDWIDLRETVERVVSAAKRRGAALSFKLDWPAQLPMIAADALLVEQAFSNVVNNAVSHTPAGTDLVIDTVITPDAISVRFTDNGPGIPGDVLPNVFDKFVRAQAAKADKGEGTGLGLAITKGIVAAHGGSVAAQSPVPPGNGTRITITFPLESP